MINIKEILPRNIRKNFANLGAAVVIPFSTPGTVEPYLSAQVICPDQAGDSIRLNIDFKTLLRKGQMIAIGLRNETEDKKGIIKTRKYRDDEDIKTGWLSITDAKSPIAGDPENINLHNGDHLIVRAYILDSGEENTDAVKRQDLIINCPEK